MSLNITVDWVVCILGDLIFKSWPGECLVRFSWFWSVLPGKFWDDV